MLSFHPGTYVSGRVVHLDPEPRVRRFSNLLNGDFTPQHTAEVKFDDLILPNGEHRPIDATESKGLPLVISGSPGRKKDKDIEAKKDGVGARVTGTEIDRAPCGGQRYP